VSVDAPNVVIETVKQAEDGNGIIVRMYEDRRNRGKINVKAGFPLAEVWHCNLLEQNEASLDFSGDQVELEVSPYQIISLRLIPAT
jgi:alpha-mannosidase